MNKLFLLTLVTIPLFGVEGQLAKFNSVVSHHDLGGVALCHNRSNFLVEKGSVLHVVKRYTIAPELRNIGIAASFIPVLP